MKRTIAVLFVMTAVLVCAAEPGMAEEWSWYRAIQVEKQPVIDVPYVPTPAEVVKRMLEVAAVSSSDVLYDLGCGDGRIVIAAARDRKVKKAVGVDIDPQRIEQSTRNAREAGVSGRVSFHRKDLFDLDLREASVVSLYLLPTINLKLRSKLLRELKPGTRIVSHDFDMADWQADRIVTLNEHTIYYWVVPASVNGSWKWSVKDDGQPSEYELSLGQRFQSIEKAEIKRNGHYQAVINVSARGDRLEFDTMGVLDGRNQLLHFTGAVKGHSLAGTVAPVKKSGSPRSWKAERDPSTALPIDTPSEGTISL